jgi:hypothetical protein
MIKSIDYLNLEISKDNIYKYSFEEYDDLILYNCLIKILKYLNRFSNDIKPFLNQINHQCKINNINKFIHCIKMINDVMKYNMKNVKKINKNYTTNNLDNIKYSKIFSRILFIIFKNIKSFQTYNNPNSLLNITFKVCIDNIQNNILNKKNLEPINSSILKIPSFLIKQLNTNLIINIQFLKFFNQTLDFNNNEICNFINSIYDFIISDQLLKYYNNL